ncbi:Imm21 family immunity protein (plasmid) [Streptomyces sp. AHU1]|uniref:Imm21 family immunity protein n=1 Tax=Streptomyces sp. AHU1 TaxID=3377215 RepID=UPI003877C04C
MGRPLIVVPLSLLAAWRGCTESGVMAGDATAADDYDRACAVDDLTGVITVGKDGMQALVLADESATAAICPNAKPSCDGLPPIPRQGYRPQQRLSMPTRPLSEGVRHVDVGWSGHALGLR